MVAVFPKLNFVIFHTATSHSSLFFQARKGDKRGRLNLRIVKIQNRISLAAKCMTRKICYRVRYGANARLSRKKITVWYVLLNTISGE